jgi:hypothetical protein
MEQLVSLCEVHERMKAQLSRTLNARIEFRASGDEQGLQYLSNAEGREMVQATLGLRRLLRNEPCKTGKGIFLDSVDVGICIQHWFNHLRISFPGSSADLLSDMVAFEITRDSTLFTEVLHSYKKIVHHLLNADAVPGLDCERLASFKQHYGSSAFVCRYRGCPRATDGYSTERRREDHETLQHTDGIKCSEVSCSWSRIGFRTSGALKRHMQDFHSTPESVKKPRLVR